MPRPKPWFLALVGIFALMLLALAGFVRPVREAIRFVFVPVARFTSTIGAGIGKGLRLDADAKTANERARELDARLRSMTVDYVRLRALEEENRSLRAQAAFIADSGFQSLGARVISRAVSYQTAAVTIDRGARDGVEIGQAAVVMFVSDIRSRIAATVSGSERLAGVIEGQGNGVTRFTLIPQAVPLKRDDIVVTAGTEEKIPANIVIGLVNEVRSQPTDPFKTASVEPLAPLDRIELVSLIIPKANAVP